MNSLMSLLQKDALCIIFSVGDFECYQQYFTTWLDIGLILRLLKFISSSIFSQESNSYS